MAEIDKVKEDIGLLKLMFGLLVAVDITLIGWTAQNFTEIAFNLFVFYVSLIFVLGGIAATICHHIYRKINRLGELP